MVTKTILQILVLSLFILFTFSCKQNISTHLSVDERLAIEDTVKQLARIVEESANQMDLDASFNLFSDDPDFTFSEDGYMKPPKDEMYKIMKPVYASFAEMFMSYDTMRISVLDRNSAVFTGEGPWTAKDLAGNEFQGHLVSMFVFVRRDGKWQMLHGHTSHK